MQVYVLFHGGAVASVHARFQGACEAMAGYTADEQAAMVVREYRVHDDVDDDGRC